MFTKSIKEFKQVEPQLLRAQYAGLYIAQRPVKYTAQGTVYGVPTVDAYGTKYIENGIICGLDVDANVVSYTTGTMFIHYTEELPTVVNTLNSFAVEVKGADTYIRLLQLFPGDEFVTDNYTGTIAEKGYATVVDGVVNLVTTSEGAKFCYYKDTLPNGTVGVHCIVLG